MTGGGPLLGHLTVLAVQADEAAHAPVRAALKAIEGTVYEVHWVTTARAALAALDEHPHDAFLIDRELHDPSHSPGASPISASG